MYDTLWREQRALAAHLQAIGHHIVFHGPGYAYDTNDVSVVVSRLAAQGQKPDIILCYLNESQLLGPLQEAFVRRFNLSGPLTTFPVGLHKVTDIPKVMWVNDFWGISPADWERAVFAHGFSHATATYCPPFVRQSDFQDCYPASVRTRIVFHALPRGIDKEMFDGGQPFNERDIDVCSLGNVSPSFYALRHYCRESLKHQSWLKFFTAAHPGYDYTGPESLTGKRYAAVLGRSKIHVCCTSSYNLPFIKLFETMASGAALMSDRPNGAEELGLVDGETYIRIDQANFMPKLHQYLRDQETLQRIAAAGRDLFLRRYTTQHNAAAMTAILEGIVAGGAQEPAFPSAQEARDGTPVPRESAPIAAPRRSVLRRVAGRCRLTVRTFLRGLPPAEPRHEDYLRPDFWPVAGNGTCLDWRRVGECVHILELATLRHADELRVWKLGGQQQRLGEHPELTRDPELTVLKTVLLRRIAERTGAESLAEVGAGRGAQSLAWGLYLETRPTCGGRVFACDMVGHDDPVHFTPLAGMKRWTRRELWAQSNASRRIRFVQGTGQHLADVLAQELAPASPLDLVCFDGARDPERVADDYRALSPFIGERTTVVFDHCDGRFPGVEQAAQAIADERGLQIGMVSFWPNPCLVAILSRSINLSELRT